MAGWQSDSEDEQVARFERQEEYMFPWDNSRPAQSGYGPQAALANPSSDEWQKRGYAEDTDKFRADVRKAYARGSYNDGTTGEDRYGGRPTVAHVGHVYAGNNGGSNTRGNIYMQHAGFNTTMQDDYDQLNAALVGRTRNAQAMQESREYGRLNEGRWAGHDAEEVREYGMDQFRSVGVLTKVEGGIDRRCAAVRRGEVDVDEYGLVHGLDSKVREIAQEYDDYDGSEDEGLNGLMSSLRF